MRIRPLRLLAWLALAVVGLLAIVGVAAWWFVTPDRIRTSLEAQASSAIGLPAHIERLSVRWFPAVALQLENVRIGDPAQLTAGELDVSAGLRGLFSRRVEDATLTVRKSRLDLPALLALAARLTNAAAGGAASQDGTGFTIASVRSIALEDVTLVAGGHEVVASVRGHLDPDTLTISSLQARTSGTNLEGSGTIAFGGTPHATFEANASELDLNALMAFVNAATAGASNADAPSSPGGPQAASPRVDLALKAARGVLGTIAFTDLETRLAMAGGDLTLDPLEARVFDGAIDGRLSYVAAKPAITLGATLNGADIGAILQWMGNASRPVTGRMQAGVDITANPSRLTPDAWRGAARVKLTGGTIRGLSAIRTVVVSLAGRRNGGSTQGTDEYEEIGGTFALQGHVVRSTDLRLTSPDLDLRGAGTITMPEGMLAIEADCVLSAQLSAEAGRDLYRYAREGDRIVIPLSIGGALGSPTVTPRAGDIMQRAIRREIEKKAGSLLDRLLKR
jgi:uncharacterized protein YhdP